MRRIDATPGWGQIGKEALEENARNRAWMAEAADILEGCLENGNPEKCKDRNWQRIADIVYDFSLRKPL